MSSIKIQETNTEVQINEIANLLKISKETTYDDSDDILHVKENM